MQAWGQIDWPLCHTDEVYRWAHENSQLRPFSQ